jgi:hypothetical protein
LVRRTPSTRPPRALPHVPQATLGGAGQLHQPAHVLGAVLHRPGQLPPRLPEPVGRLLDEPAPGLGARLRAAAGDLVGGFASPTGRLGAGLGAAACGFAPGPEGLHVAALPLVRLLLMLGLGHVLLLLRTTVC